MFINEIIVSQLTQNLNKKKFNNACPKRFQNSWTKGSLTDGILLWTVPYASWNVSLSIVTCLYHLLNYSP